MRLASLKSREDGTRELERLRRLIGDAAVELGLEGAEGERFRVVAGGSASRAATEAYCQSLKRRRLDCLLSRN